MKTERIKSPEERAQETEYQRRRSLPGVEVRRMHTARSSDQVLSHNGCELGSRSELMTRGKVVSVHYALPPLPADLTKPSRAKLERLVWQHTPSAYRGTLADGQKSILMLEKSTGATVLAPLSTLTEAQLLDKLPSAVRAELESQ